MRGHPSVTFRRVGACWRGTQGRREQSLDRVESLQSRSCIVWSGISDASIVTRYVGCDARIRHTGTYQTPAMEKCRKQSNIHTFQSEEVTEHVRFNHQSVYEEAEV